MTDNSIIKKLLVDFDCRISGQEIQLCCFLCKEKRYRLYINRIKLLGHCFNCGRSFNENFLKIFLKIDSNTKTYLKTDFSFLDSFIKQSTLSTVESFHIPGIFADDYNPKTNLDYSRVRELSIKFLQSKGFEYSYICRQYKFILGDPSGFYAGRLILPVFENGQIVYYQARSVCGELPKYLNPKKTIYGKSEVVFNLDNIPEGEKVIICEGIFSAISCGFNAVAILGKELSDVQKFKILSKKPSEIIILLDAGENAASLKMAKAFFGRSEIRIAQLLTGDPNEVSLEELQGSLKDAQLYSGILDF